VVAIDVDGNLVVSMRNTSAVYKINRQNGKIMWTAGGKAPSFRMGPGTTTWGQHDAVVAPGELLTMFDNEGGPRVKRYSRVVSVALDTRRNVAKLVRQYGHSPPLPSNFEGSAQPL